MDSRQYLSFDTSILYRASQKHFDRIFARFGLGYGQSLFLTYIYENEGVAMSKLADLGNFDKGTITHSINKLTELGFVEVRASDSDKRVKNLYTTSKCQEVINFIYLERQKWWDRLFQKVEKEDMEKYFEVSNIIKEEALNAENEIEKENHLRIFGIQKLTLLDYPGKLATILFTGGCNFRCPFCHNKSLVFLDEDNSELNGEDILELLNKRQGLIDGVVISGGEPLIQEGLVTYLRKIKDMGFKIKLDTNGLLSEKLAYLIDEGLIDYVAMDIKNSPEKYAMTAGVQEVDLNEIKKSIELLKNSAIDYEFRTTIVDELHDVEDIAKIAMLIKGAKHYYLQKYRDSEGVIKKGYHAPSNDKLNEMLKVALKYVETAEIRGED